jgi:hypothetical protein
VETVRSPWTLEPYRNRVASESCSSCIVPSMAGFLPLIFANQCRSVRGG